MSSKFYSDFLLETDFAKALYESSGSLPIIDYHSHLPVEVIAKNEHFENITDIWIRGDHYKWRAMRLNGIPEAFCSGESNDWDKFEAWSNTLPLTIRNPLYHWSNLELRRYFDIEEKLTPKTAKTIWDKSNEFLKLDSHRPRELLRLANVQVLCTTDDPADSLEHHKKIRSDSFEVKVIPTFRPDFALMIDEPLIFKEWVDRLAQRTDREIFNFTSFLEALKLRHDAFAEVGCCFSDHGIERCYSDSCSEADAHRIFNKYLNGEMVGSVDVDLWRSYLMYEFARWGHEKGWTMLLHIGAIRNNNHHMFNKVGRDSGCDSIGDFEHAKSLNLFLGLLDLEGRLPKTVLFNSNPRDNLLFASIIGNFFEDGVVGKVQYGPSWWFLDTPEGIIKQLNSLSQVGLFSHFIGMVTDSRSFLSFTRHDYFRRIVCNMIGEDVRRGLIDNDITQLKRLLEKIFYTNAFKYIGDR